MAVNYTQLFGDVGKFIKAIDQFRGMSTATGSPKPDLVALQSGIETQLVASGRQDILEGIVSTFDGFRDSASSWATMLSDRAVSRLTHRESVVNQLPATISPDDVAGVIRELLVQMVQDGQTIARSTVTIGSVTPYGANKGNGSVVTTRVLDGVTPPSPGMAALATNKGKNSELAVPTELMSLTCITDEDNNGAPEGSEVFRLEGQPTNGGAFGWRTEGSGVSVDIPVNNSYDILNNRDFEIFLPNNAPPNWTIKSGTLGTTIIGDTAAANVHRGTGSLKFGGAGELRQRLDVGSIVPNRMYCFSAAIKGSAGADGILTIGFTSDSGGYTPVISEQIVLDSIGLPLLAGGFQQLSVFWLAPTQLPSDLEFQIKYTGTAAGAVWVDSVTLGPVVYANGIGVAILAGSAQFALNDRYTFTVTNSEAVVQRFFRRRLGVQLPSSASPSIADAVAT